MEDRQWFVLYVLVCLEVGFFLILVPWSAIWERNYFLEAFPSLRPVILSPTLRGAVCGLGLGNVYVGLSEILGRLRTARGARAAEQALQRDLSARSDNAERDVSGEALASPEER